MKYDEFLQSKVVQHKSSGFNAKPINPFLFDWQQKVVEWALIAGKAALFEERGLGKTLQQVEWSKHVADHTKGQVLIVCPLAVAAQTIREAAKIDLEVKYCRTMDNVGNHPIVITNYDMIKHFDLSVFSGIVLDESSILKNYTGKTKQFLIEQSKAIPYKLACTATPAPNDNLELGNHADWLDVMPSNEMIARWFINDTMEAGGYRLKNYAAQDFYFWLTSWGVFVNTPSDLGYSDDGFILPPMEIKYHQIGVDHSRAFDQMDDHGQRRLFLGDAPSATGMWAEKRETYQDRVKMAVDIDQAEPNEYHIIWCDTNEESKLLKKLIPNSVEVKGSDSIDDKESKIKSFSEGSERVIITKGTITGMGMNWQHCAKNTFVSTNYKWEEWYQAIGRTHRFGQTRPVAVNMIYSETEQNIIKTLARKGEQHRKMQQGVVGIIKQYGLQLQDRRRIMFDVGQQRVKLPAFLGGYNVSH